VSTSTESRSAERRRYESRRGTFEKREPRRHIREKRAESFRHSRMGENGIAQVRMQVRIWQARQHSHLYHGHDLAGFGAYHREAKNVVVTRGDKRLQFTRKPLSYVVAFVTSRPGLMRAPDRSAARARIPAPVAKADKFATLRSAISWRRMSGDDAQSRHPIDETVFVRAPSVIVPPAAYDRVDGFDHFAQPHRYASAGQIADLILEPVYRFLIRSKV
jgi:hypothetical protein